MFNLMSNCCTWFSKIQEPIRRVTVLVVGLDKAGKTSSIRGMLRAPNAAEGGPTHGCVRSQLRVENYLVTLLDVGGSSESRGGWREFYGEAHGFVFVVDSGDRPRIKEVKEVLAEMLKQPRVAGKPLLVLANKQDKANALLGSELIETLSLEKMVNQSRSLCHIEPCSALMDLRRRSDRKAFRGLRWLLRAVCLDYPQLCARVARDGEAPPEPAERDGKTEKPRRRHGGERVRSSKSDLRQVQRPKNKENASRGERKLQPIRDTLQKENAPKKRKKRPVKADDAANGREEGERRNALGQPGKTRPRRKGGAKDGTPAPQSPRSDRSPLRAKGEKRKKKRGVKVKRRNKINTEETSGASSQDVDLSATFDLYRKAILALKERQENRGQ
ncbi:ADP-ribosylation factor-like protein 13A isoform X2 [Syngnathoides biaculeatus]|nr:ADP-ribosylation factor-like protein 13A isoform X2 [Syngnathoides biaculeatus]XP_061690051.1 ADP-ribosylation factor-like protein 13A isoform X2 [Syngnathoides biaculeatus]